MSSYLKPFLPNGNTVNVTPTTTPNSGTSATKVADWCSQYRVYNASGSDVFLKTGTDNTATASTSTSKPIPNGALEVFSWDKMAPLYFDAIIASGTASGKVYITPGAGI